MPITPSWRPLPSTPSSDVPPLLVSMEGGPADYTVRVTDMANVWVESLDRKRICMRAWDLNTSIDPSDTPENMAKFLTSIRSALDTSMSGHAQTSLALLPGTRESIGSDGLVLKINCEIPGLQTLRWTMQLAKAPASAIATSVVLPLIQAQVARTQEIEALTDLIRRKDSVMTKLLDKFETTGTGLENIFNSLSTSLSGRKKVNRAAAGEKVRGLAPFNQDEWREEMRNAADGPADVTSLLSCVFNGNGMPHESPIEMEETPGLDQWWHHFQGTKHVSLQNRPKKSPAKAPNPPTTETGVTGDDDDFQVQSTPPGLKASGGKNIDSTTVVAEEDLTASEDDAHSPQVPAKTSTQHKASTETGVARLGTIGGKRQPSKQPSPSPEPKTPRKTATPPDHDSETASEGDDDPTASLPASSSPQSPAKPPAGKVGLGRIGGPKPKAAQEERVARSTSPDEAPKQTATPKKLGIIGKRGPDTKRTVAGDDNGRGRSCEATQPTREAPRETSQERADRKRDELKRELEKKAAAGPAKKKRKF